MLLPATLQPSDRLRPVLYVDVTGKNGLPLDLAVLAEVPGTGPAHSILRVHYYLKGSDTFRPEALNVWAPTLAWAPDGIVTRCPECAAQAIVCARCNSVGVVLVPAVARRTLAPELLHVLRLPQ
jgi:hypothetical protein